MFSQYPCERVGSHTPRLGYLRERGPAEIHQVRREIGCLIVSNLHDYPLWGAFGCERLVPRVTASNRTLG